MGPGARASDSCETLWNVAPVGIWIALCGFGNVKCSLQVFAIHKAYCLFHFCWEAVKKQHSALLCIVTSILRGASWTCGKPSRAKWKMALSLPTFLTSCWAEQKLSGLTTSCFKQPTSSRHAVAFCKIRQLLLRGSKTTQQEHAGDSKSCPRRQVVAPFAAIAP